MSISVFISTVSDEFRVYRDQLIHDLTRHNVAVKVQEDFKGLGDDTLDKLDVYIAHCDAVVHLVGEMTGAFPGKREQQALIARHPDLPDRLASLEEALLQRKRISYTQWEAWLALYHAKRLFMAKAEPAAPRGPRFDPTDQSRAEQEAHLTRLRSARRYPDFTFGSEDGLAKHVLGTAILDLLVEDYAREVSAARDVAEGFIREMAARVAAAPDLDLDRMKEAVHTAIDLYVQEIAGGPTRTNLGDIVDRALANANRLTDEGKSRLARAALRTAADTLKREEQERRAAYTNQVRILFGRERDIALATYDGDAAAEAIVSMVEELHPESPSARRVALIAEGDRLYEFGDKRGSNVHQNAAIAVRRATLHLASAPDEVGLDQNNLGNALLRLGERESGTARLEEAVAAYRAALEEYTRDRVPLDWAMTQSNLGIALWKLGERESGTARLEEAVAAFRAALEETKRDQAPHDWAMTQVNLGSALSMLGARESGTARLEEAVAAFCAALQEAKRDQVPLQWAMTQANLGSVLSMLGARESGTAHLEEAVAAFHAALGETTRDRVPLQWAMIQVNLANALVTLGERENGTAHLEEAIAAFRTALEERRRDRVPLQWATTQMNLGAALSVLGERESGTAHLEEAVAAFRAALEETTRDRVPLQWAMAQMNLGTALETLGERANEPALLEEAVEAYHAALEERTRDRVPLDWAMTQMNLGNALSRLSEGESGTARLEEAVAAWNACLEVTTCAWPSDWVRIVEIRRAEAQDEILRRSSHTRDVG